MKTVKLDTDYYLYLTCGDIALLTTPYSTLGDFKYNPLSSAVVTRGGVLTGEELQLMCTNEASIIWDPEKAHDDIYFDTDEEGPLVRVHPRKLIPLPDGEHIMTRYDGHSSKIFIFRDDSLE